MSGGAIQIQMPGLQPQPPAFGHGVARVDRQVEDHLLQHVDIGVDVRGPVFADDFKLHGLARCAPEHLRHAGDHFVEVEVAWLQDLFAAEREQLPGEICRAPGRP